MMLAHRVPSHQHLWCFNSNPAPGGRLTPAPWSDSTAVLLQAAEASRSLRSVARLGRSPRWPVRAAAEGASGGSTSTTTKTIPIFPLGIVALPATNVPLRIFEARYRVLFNTLLAGATGLEEGLINWDSPFCGTRSFGMCFVSEQGLAAIGTMLHIDTHERLDDGQMLIENTGKERFQILRVVEERPVLICEVEMLQEDEDTSDEASTTAKEIVGLLRDTLVVNSKLQKQTLREDMLSPRSLDEFSPCELSFWVGSLFRESPAQQQALLQENNTMRRLSRVKSVLESTLKYLTAQSALASAFSGSDDSPSAGAAPPQGGPD